MTAAYLMLAAHLRLSSAPVWAFLVALSLIAIECVLIAKADRRHQTAPAPASRPAFLPAYVVRTASPRGDTACK